MVQPARMNRSMYQDQVVIALLQALYGAGTPMRRAVIHDPKYPPGLGIRWPAHNIGHQPIKRFDAAFGLTTAKQFDPVYIQGGEVGPGTAAAILMFHLHHGTGLGRVSGMAATAGLDTGFFISREDEFVILEGTTIPDAFIEVQDSSGFAGKLGIARKDPRPISPGANCILMKPAPYGTVADRSNKAGLPDPPTQIGDTPARQG